jgi:hypothetical protein
MDRRSLIVGLLAGGWVTTLAFAVPGSPFRAARAEDPPHLQPPQVQPTSPFAPTSPGRTINPIDGPTGTRPVTGNQWGMSDSNRSSIAIACPVGSGGSVVYYFDTALQRLLVYQYDFRDREGDKGGIRLLAARHFDYDLKLEGYRDLSEKSRDELKSAYDAAFSPPVAPSPGSPIELPTKKVENPLGK